MRLAWFSPLPPIPSGIADYSFELLPYLAERADVDAICPRPGWLRRPRVPSGVTVRTPDAFARRPEGYDAVLYHLGNNPHHEFVYEAAQARPGIAVFHELVLHHLIAHLMVERGIAPARYSEIMREEHGAAGERLAELRWGGVATDLEKFLFPLAGHVARRAKAIVVHNRDAAERIGAIAPGVPITVIPHFAPAAPLEVQGVSRERARAILGLPERAFVVGHFGYVTRPKHPGAVIGGFARLAASHPEAVLVQVGADHSGGGLELLIERHGLRDRVRVTGFVDLVRFSLYLRAADALVNLRYPSAGESSGTLARALAEGKAVIVNNVGSFAELDDDTVLKVEVDEDQTEGVARHLLALAGDPLLRQRVGARARAYAEANLDPRRCRDLYLEAASAGL